MKWKISIPFCACSEPHVSRWELSPATRSLPNVLVGTIVFVFALVRFAFSIDLFGG